MVNKPIVEVMEGGAKLAKALNDAGVPVTFGKRSEGNTDLSGVIDLASNNIGSGSSVDIVTEWEEELSDEKVPSEKLTKNTLDTKADTSSLSTVATTGDYNDLINKPSITKTGTFTDLKTLITSASSGNIIVLDKDYKYDSTIDTSPVLSYGVPIEKNITIIGNGHVIDGNDTVRALSITGEYVVNLYDLRIQNCKSTINAFGGAIYIDQNATVNMTNLQVINNSVVGDGCVGGAIAAWDSTINITNTEFIQNNVTGIETRAGAIFVIGNISLNKCTFKDNTATLRAGAIHINGNLSMIDCSFKDNTATNYANIYSNNAVTIYDCIIPNVNTSCYNVSNITTESLNTSKQNTLESGTNIRTINGESLLGSGDISTESAGSFDDLETLIYNAFNSGLTILTLHKDYVNDGSYSDEGILLNHNTNLIIDGRGHILDAQYNGRIFKVFTDNVHVDINLTFRNVIFHHGDFIGNGGAVHINNATVTFENCGFIDNYVSDSGGAIYLEDGDLNLFDSYFKWCGALSGIGDIYSYKSINVYNCDIPNIATSCYNVTNKPYQEALISGSNIKTVNNESLLGSGNITIQGGVGSFTDLQSLITSASDSSTLILDKDYKYDSTTDSSLTYGVEISKNITIIGNGHVIDGNNDKRAFYINGSSNITVNLYDLRIQNCKSNNGGAIYVYTGATVNINNILFNNNTTSGGGGAISAYDGTTVNINNTLFHQNSANSSGGAIHANDATVTIKNSNFYNNTAQNYNNIWSYNEITAYDCIILNIATSCFNVTNKPYLTDHQSLSSKQDVLVSGTNIKTVNNESLLGSGNITIQGGVGSFTDLQSLITSASSGATIILDKDYKYDSTTDSSLTDGIGINKNITIIGNGHIIDGDNSKRAFNINGNYTLTLIDLIIQNCHSTGHGGAIYSQGGTINISNVSFIKNSTTRDGGAIYASSGGTINIINSLFNWNNASSWGGAIKINGATLIMQNSSFNGNTANRYADIDCSSSTNVINCSIPNIATSCHNVTNKPYLTDHQSLSGYLTTSDIANDLTTTTAGKVLDARQGKALNDLIGQAISYINQ